MPSLPRRHNADNQHYVKCGRIGFRYGFRPFACICCHFDRGGEGVGLACNICGCHLPTKKMKLAIQSKHFPIGDKVPAPIKDPPYVLPATLPKTDTQRIKELKRMLIEGQGEHVVQKVLDIALDDAHPGQMAALKMCMDRALPASLFEKTAAQRSAINITISTLGAPQIVESAPDDNITDVEAKDV